MSFLQHAPELNSSQGRLCRPEGFETQHRANYPLDKPVILLDNIIQVLALADFYTLVFIAIVLLDRGRVGATFVNIDQAGLAVGSDGFIQNPPLTVIPP